MNSLPEKEYEAFLAELGRLCLHWAQMDHSLSGVLMALLDIPEEQVFCISTDMADVTPRCRLVSRLVYTVKAPDPWRAMVTELCNTVANDIGPRRNRFIHDYWYESGTYMTKIDRRAKVVSRQSFQPKRLVHEVLENYQRDDVEHLSVRVIVAMNAFDAVRLDLQARGPRGRFPKQPILSLDHLRLFGPDKNLDKTLVRQLRQKSALE